VSEPLPTQGGRAFGWTSGKKSSLHQPEPDAWVPIRRAAQLTELCRPTIYAWITRYHIRTRLHHGRREVWLPDVMRTEAATRPERQRRKKAA
jgi:hypothetical protein